MSKRRKKTGPPPGYERLQKLPLAFPVGSFRCEMQYWGWLGEKWWRNYMHVHTFYEICYAFEGAGTFEMLGTTYQIKPGQVFVAKPREEHEIISSRRNVLGVYFWAYTLVPPTTAKAIAARPGTHRTDGIDEGAAAIDRLLHAFIESKRWVSGDAAGMLRTLQLIVEEVAARRPGYMSSIEGLTRKLIIDTARSVVDGDIGSEQPLPRSDNPDTLVVERATRYMRDNYARALAVSEVAGQVSLSERHLNRLFQKHLNKTPLDVLTTIRIEAASQLLLDRNLAIKDIAARVGYPDVRYFTTVFRQATRSTPAAYRTKVAPGTSWVDPEHALNRP
jgi:AraC family L-rhamnose operon transcriptional activator RhaR